MKRVSVLFGMFVGQNNMWAASAGEIVGSIPRNNVLVHRDITRMLVSVKEGTRRCTVIQSVLCSWIPVCEGH